MPSQSLLLLLLMIFRTTLFIVGETEAQGEAALVSCHIARKWLSQDLNLQHGSEVEPSPPPSFECQVARTPWCGQRAQLEGGDPDMFPCFPMLFLASSGHHPSVLHPSQTPGPMTLAQSQGPCPAQPRDLRGSLHSRHTFQGSHGASCLQDTQT